MIVAGAADTGAATVDGEANGNELDLMVDGITLGDEIGTVTGGRGILEDIVGIITTEVDVELKEGRVVSAELVTGAGGVEAIERTELELGEGGDARTELLEGTGATKTTEEVDLELGEGRGRTTELLDGAGCMEDTEKVDLELDVGREAIAELLDGRGTTETVEVLILGGGKTDCKLEEGTLAEIDGVPRITVPILLLSGRGGGSCGDGLFSLGGPPTSAPLVFDKMIFPSTVIGIGATISAACLIAV